VRDVNRLPHRLAFAAGLAAFALTGCGGSETNGLEDKSAADVQQAAAAALKSATSVHMAGTSIDEERPGQVDVRIQGDSSSGTLTLEGVTFEIVAIGEDTYMKGDERALQVVGAPAAAASLGAGRWLKLGPDASLEGFTLDDIAAQLTQFESPLEPEVEESTLDDNKVVIIRREDGTRLHVANTGIAYPLRAEGPNAGQVDFSEYGADFDITAPQSAVEISELAEPEDVDVFDLAVGDCLSEEISDKGEEVTNVAATMCSEPHSQEIFASATVPDGDFPGQDAVNTQAEKDCVGLFSDFVGVAYEESQLEISYLTPTEESWETGDREILCTLYDPAGDTTGTLAGANR